MRKRSLVTMIGSLALVGALGVGATLAYLSDKADDLTNTFTFTSAGIGIALDEADVDDVTNQEQFDADGKSVRTAEGATQNYENIIPGMTIHKDPTVTVKANSLNCNVFVSVQNANAAEVLTIGEMGTWTEVNPADYGFTAADDTTYYVYSGDNATGTVEENDAFKVVATSATDTVLDDVFEKVTFSGTINADTVFENIVIKAAAVQADYCSDEDAAKTALGMLVVAE